MTQPEPNMSAESLLIRQRRCLIMSSLNQYFPTRVLIKTLYRVVIGIDPDYDKILFIKDFFYLQKKGYVELITNPLKQTNELEDKLTVLTADGKEVAEHTMTDPAMKI